jgi:hypothetical protein
MIHSFEGAHQMGNPKIAIAAFGRPWASFLSLRISHHQRLGSRLAFRPR